MALLGGALYAGWNRYSDARAASSAASIFAGYVDVTATPTYAFENPQSEPAKSVVLSFIVAEPGKACEPSWGAAYSLDRAGHDLDLDRRIARLLQQGGGVSVSFGGQANTELAIACADPAALQASYAAVIDRYNLTTIDLDLEGGGLSDAPAMKRRAAAVAALQADRRSAGKPLSVWLTLPVSPAGLSAEGISAVAGMLAAHVDVAGVNIMTMNYGRSRAAGQSMLGASVAAAESTHEQLSALYRARGKDVGPESIWRKIGLTPMIGQGDVRGDIFTMDDARGLQAFAKARGVGRMSMWSLNRDTTCGPNYPDLSQVSDACSGINENGLLFSRLLGEGMNEPGEAAPDVSAPAATSAPTPTTDNPATSPYPIWNEAATYVAEDRIVWHGNVYEAKWWTNGDLPDNPLALDGSTPWRLVGPVLPGDTPAPELLVPAGTYPAWKDSAVYQQGDRVMFDRYVFEAKWWTRGDSPEAALRGSADLPWKKLKNDVIEQIIKERAAK
ncbi:chitinase [Specibacter sp. RAF43]|uniref:chitinase n=1 Tax=Specibacter sp. RAF43 TaxID=3233057 RepID=UPI003F968D6D